MNRDESVTDAPSHGGTQLHHSDLRAGSRRAASNLALLLASLVVTLGLGELLTRITAPQQLILKRPDVWQAVDTLGWAHRPNVHTTINTGERTVQFITDADGLRVGARGPINADTRILLLGDSFIEALQVEYENTVAGLLEARLPHLIGHPVAVRNAGVGDWGPPQYYLRARSLLEREHFDLAVVALYLGNDVADWRPGPIKPRTPIQTHPLRIPTSLRWAEIIEAVLYPVNDFLETRSQLFILFKTRAQTVLMRLGLTADYFPSELLRSAADSPRWEATADICHDIAALTQSHGTPTLFVLIPAPVQVNRRTLKSYLHAFDIDPRNVDLEQPNRLVLRALSTYNLRVIDVLPAFLAAREGGTKLYGDVDPHLTAQGHDLLEKHIEPAVAALLYNQ